MIEIKDRFRNYLPVIIDVETGGLNAKTDALLEIAAVLLDFNEQDELVTTDFISTTVLPFDNAKVTPEATKINKINVKDPEWQAQAQEETEALKMVFAPIRKKLKETGCKRAILTGHNPMLDLQFLNAAIERTQIKRTPFHPFSSFDTATLAGLAVGQTVLSTSCKAAGIEFDGKLAHSALYDATKTAELFCYIVNRWQALNR